MSKLIEALKSSNEISDKKNEYQMTQEQLANIYFGGSENALSKQLKNQPVVIRVVEKPGFYKALPWIISSFALLLLAFSLFSTKKIFIDIHVSDEDELASKPKSKVSRMFSDNSYGNAIAFSLENVIFEGAAKDQSSIESNRLTLINNSVSSFARANIVPAYPMNLEGYKIVFKAKGSRGGEQLAVGLKDQSNAQAFEKGRFFPFPGGLTTQWQEAQVSLENVLEGFNRSHVSGLRFEFGSNVQNRNGDTVFIKDLKLVPVNADR